MAIAYSTLNADSANYGNKELKYSFVGRGLEIRYIVLKKSQDKTKNTISVEGKNYPLYKTREDAVNAVTNTNVKQDFVVVYVISEKNKATETIALD
jgi:hypothetical protein